MNSKDEYNLKRNHFIEKTKKYFNFLISDFGYNIPIYKKYEQPNGFITRDEFIFAKENKSLLIANSYHPDDYGFEVLMKNLETHTEDLLYFEVKEQQEISQNYLKNIAKLLEMEHNDKL